MRFCEIFKNLYVENLCLNLWVFLCDEGENPVLTMDYKNDKGFVFCKKYFIFKYVIDEKPLEVDR